MKRDVLLAGLFGLLAVSLGQASEKQAVPMSDYGTGTYYVSVGVHNVSESEFMVDTGSGYVIVDQDFITDLIREDKARYVRGVHLTTADGNVVGGSVYHLESLTIGRSCQVNNIEVVVLPNGSKCILGLSALSKAAPFTFSTEPPTLTLSNCLSAGI